MGFGPGKILEGSYRSGEFHAFGLLEFDFSSIMKGIDPLWPIWIPDAPSECYVVREFSEIE